MAPSLPPETLLLVFSFLEDDIFACASVCREWQVAAESITFSSLLANSANIEDLCRIVGRTSTPWRPSFVQELEFKCILPTYGIQSRAYFETESDRHSNNKAVTQAISSLFEVLGSWPDHNRNEMKLVLFSRSPSDWEAEPDWDQRKARMQQNRAFPEKDLMQARYESSYLQLLSTADISTVKCVTELRIYGASLYRGFSPQSVSEMVCRLPRLQELSVDLSDKDRKNPTERDHHRHELSRGIAKWPSSLKRFRLDCLRDPACDGKGPLRKLSEPGADSLSLALHRLTQQLETVDLTSVMVGPEFFWPACANKTITCWPNLTTIDVRYAPATPSGTWLFERDPKYQGEDDGPSIENSYPRTKPNESLNGLYVAAGRAAQQMPRLRTMVLQADMASTSTRVQEAFDSIPGHWFQYTSSSARATWICTSEYHVTPEVREVWDAVAKNHGRGHVKIENLGFRHDADEMGGHKSFYSDEVGFDEEFKKEYGCFSWDS
ncbi:hypothetical protein PENANT_c007G10995 [Penicillium antarcticum]|uniref:Uncharacterized protein n=1 Tax=Penicillium antarcticum TaxID=416450 RepID=A0A1V6QBM5_9EURO|nr:hypothetical protein PENANT_c007G10995 [Penicillium antarcticum]